jgi:tetratricopeptide (TPR) repeat protein/tRNA A-37 threonylcarbamoyl transferase component Bud32
MEAGQQSKDELIVNLFLAAMACLPEQRDSFLAEACSGDKELLPEIRRRVDWEVRMGGFLLTPVVSREKLDKPFGEGETVLGRFRILRVAGEGGMGVVYEALDSKLNNRRIALKCPRFEFRKRLSPEALNALLVHHPNVCRVFDIHTAETNAGDVDFLTMEFVDGETLAARLEQAPPRWLRSKPGLDIAWQLCAGLKAIHDRGLIHRDLKPNNIMLTPDGRVVITDFGIAQGGEFFSSQIRGAQDYVAPELWRGEAPGPRSDIYALGVLLYEMATGGRKPFLPWAQWRERLHGVPEVADIPGQARAVILRCLQPDPAKRYADAGEVATALRASPARRWILLAGAAALVSSTPAIKSRYWPRSPVRLAILRPVLTDVDAADALLFGGFLLDLLYRLRTLRNVRRPLIVFDPWEVHNIADATSITADNRSMVSRIGASHSLAMEFRQHYAGAQLFEGAAGPPLRQAERKSATSNMAELLLDFQPVLIAMLDEQLHLRSTPRPATLPAPAYADYLQGLGLVRDMGTQGASAIPYFERVIAAAPLSALGHAGLAEALMISGQTGRALDALNAAEQLDPESGHVHLIAGRLYARGGQYQRALSEAQRAAELEPGQAEAFIRMAYYHFYLKRPREAEAALNKAIAAQSGYYKSYVDAGLLQFELRNFEGAEKYWLEAVRLAPGLGDVRINLGAIYQRTGRLAEARRMAMEAVSIKRNSRGLELLADLEPPEQAIELYEEALRIGAPSYTTWASLGSAYVSARREGDAAGAFRKGLRFVEDILRERPSDAEIVAWCAFYHARLGEADLARSRAAEAAALKSLQGNVRKRLILAYGWIEDLNAANQLLVGAPADLVTELRNQTDLPPALRGDPRLKPSNR